VEALEIVVATIAMVGYSGTVLVKKLGIKEDFRVGFVNSPKGFEKELKPLPNNVKIMVEHLSKPLDLIILFADSERALNKAFSNLAQKLKPNGMLWIAWPKKSSGVPTDLSFDNVQQIGLRAGMVDVKICAVNDMWSGLKFVYRLKDRKSH
jgi:hypothetical protein